MLYIKDGIFVSSSRTENGSIIRMTDELGSEVLFYTDVNIDPFDCCGNSIPWETAEPGTRCAAVLSDTIPMTMSIPPQIHGAYAFLLPKDNPVVCGTFDENMEDMQLRLCLSVNEETILIDLQGDRLPLSEMAGKEVVVVCGKMTKSIPAYTNPMMILVPERIC